MRARWTGREASMGVVRYTYKIEAGKPTRKRPFERIRHQWEHKKITLKK
jgi:hypothetical protein